MTRGRALTPARQSPRRSAGLLHRPANGQQERFRARPPDRSQADGQAVDQSHGGGGNGPAGNGRGFGDMRRQAMVPEGQVAFPRRGERRGYEYIGASERRLEAGAERPLEVASTGSLVGVRAGTAQLERPFE